MSKSEERVDLLSLGALVLTVYALSAILADTFWSLPQETSRLIQISDTVICFLLLGEFSYRLYKAENKWKFLKWGWVDLLASIPMIDSLRFGRLFRILRLLRIIRAFRSAHALMKYLFAKRAQGTLISVITLGVLLVISSSIAILTVETDPNSNILTAEDALWWSYVTITTVGYGDKFPVTTEGRLIGVVLMTYGIGIFGAVTAYASSHFLGEKSS